MVKGADHSYQHPLVFHKESEALEKFRCPRGLYAQQNLEALWYGLLEVRKLVNRRSKS